LREVVAICDDLAFFGSRQLEHEIGRESRNIPPNLLIQPPLADTVQFSKVCVDNYPEAAQHNDPVANVRAIHVFKSLHYCLPT